MVKTRLWFTSLVLSLVLSSFAAGCSQSKWWGEGRRRIVMLREKTTGKSCPSLDLLIKGSETESLAAFNCMHDQMAGIWKQIETEKNQFLSNDEIAILIRNKIINVPGDSERVISRLFAIVKLMGFKDGIDKPQLDKWLSWLENNRSKIRGLFQKATLFTEPLVYQDATDTAAAVSEALSIMNWEMTSEQLGKLILDVVEIKNPGNTKYVENAVEPAGKIVREVLGMLCVELNQTPIHIWRVNEMGQCLVRLGRGLAPGAKWFEFVANKSYTTSPSELRLAREALDKLQTIVRDWLSDCNDLKQDSPEAKTCNRLRAIPLTTLHTENLIELSRAMGAPPPEHFLDDLELITYFPGGSTQKEITPRTLAVLLQVIRNWQVGLIDGISEYVQATQNKSCANDDADYWKNCVLRITPEIKEAHQSIAFAYKIKNQNWGTTAVPMDGYVFSKIMFFRAISGAMIDAKYFSFSGNPAAIESYIEKNPKLNYVATFITAGLRMGDTFSRLIGNIKRQLNQEILFETSAGGGLASSGIGISSLAALITTGSDLFVEPDEKLARERENLLTDYLGRIGAGPVGPTLLWEDTTTAILSFADSLGRIKNSYIGIDSKTGAFKNGEMPSYVKKSEYGDGYLIHRKIFMDPNPEGPLGQAIRINYPRTYESCVKWGFEKSCAVALDEIVPNAYGHSEYITEGDLHVITLILSGVESLVDFCDYNHDGRIRTATQLGKYDELDCVFSRSTEIVKRLMDTNIIKWGVSQKFWLTSVMNVADLGFILRAPGKVLLARGAVDNPFLGFLTWWYHNE
ncbi:MAG: hypothetical protein AABZ55_02190, partial [Bdellovibrionota bacterium]